MFIFCSLTALTRHALAAVASIGANLCLVYPAWAPSDRFFSATQFPALAAGSFRSRGSVGWHPDVVGSWLPGFNRLHSRSRIFQIPMSDLPYAKVSPHKHILLFRGGILRSGLFPPHATPWMPSSVLRQLRSVVGASTNTTFRISTYPFNCRARPIPARNWSAVSFLTRQHLWVPSVASCCRRSLCRWLLPCLGNTYNLAGWRWTVGSLAATNLTGHYRSIFYIHRAFTNAVAEVSPCLAQCCSH
ncbi:hypothetical protein V1505DRAFT_23569 [Lipomyces doorenjongii]